MDIGCRKPDVGDTLNAVTRELLDVGGICKSETGDTPVGRNGAHWQVRENKWDWRPNGGLWVWANGQGVILYSGQLEDS